MKKVLVTMGSASFAVVLLAFGLVACGSSTPDSLKTTLRIGFTAYAEGYQPALKFYSSLPSCGNPAQPPCKDKELYKKLYDADAAVATCAPAAVASINSETPDYSLIGECLTKIEQAKLTFAGPVAKGAVQ